MAFMAVIMGLGLLFYILLGFRKSLFKEWGGFEGIKCNGNMKFRRHRLGFWMQTFLQIGRDYTLGMA